MTSVSLSGETRIFFILGDPVAQVKSPAGLTAELQRRGHDAIVVPIHVSAADVGGFLDMALRLQNVDGLIATVPHKHTAYRRCASATPRAPLLAAARRAGCHTTTGIDMFDASVAVMADFMTGR